MTDRFWICPQNHRTTRGDIDLPQTNAYAEEIRYFKDCVNEGRFPDKVKPEELKQVLHILNTL